MFRILALLTLFVSLHSQATSIHSGHISKIDISENNNEDPLIFFSDGYVFKLSSFDRKYLPDYIEAQRDNLILKVTVKHNREILAVETLGQKKLLPSSSKKIFFTFEPSVLNSEQEVLKIFNSLRKGARRNSQCYNRAHIWSYESKRNFDLNGMKVFIFYTKKYIREYNFKWWFHVSPFTYVNVNEEKQERVLDLYFSPTPLPMKKWTDLFMYNKVTCPDIQRYSDYENNQEKAYCYLYKTHMFDYQPLDLATFERQGSSKDDWVSWEIKNAYRNGFRVW